MTLPFPANRSMQRRQFLGTGLGLGGIALQSLLQEETWGEGKRPNFAPKAKSVIWLFMRGGVSHMESFDPKPELTKHAGKSIVETQWKSVQDPERLKKVRVVIVNDGNGQQRTKLYPLQVGFQKYGQSGIEVSDWFPHIGKVIDDVAVIRSMWTTDDNHTAQVQFHSGRHHLDERVPTIGAWIHYGLSSINQNLPQFVSIGPRNIFHVRDGHYLGPAHDAIPLSVNPKSPLPYAQPEFDLTHDEQQVQFELINRLNRLTQNRYQGDEKLDARTKSYQLAFRMQKAIPAVVDFAGETEETQRLYGLGQKKTETFARQLLMARRMAEQGTRFIQITHGAGAAGAWDAHSNLKSNHTNLAAQVDQPVSALITDLKRRGMLDETIVVFATEFGRTPGSQNGNGRDHHPYGFSVLMAGGGLKGGIVHGGTDPIGFHAVQDPHYVTDVHATIMKQLGLDPRRLSLPQHKRLEIDYGQPIDEIIV